MNVFHKIGVFFKRWLPLFQPFYLTVPNNLKIDPLFLMVFLRPYVVHCQVKGVLEAFLRMPDDLQEEYLLLANKYDENPSQWSEYSRQLFVIKEEQVQGLGLTALSEETAKRVWQIQETNSFQNGVFLKIARFNHSCCPNAEFSWIQKIGRREVLNEITKFL